MPRLPHQLIRFETAEISAWSSFEICAPFLVERRRPSYSVGAILTWRASKRSTSFRDREGIKDLQFLLCNSFYVLSMFAVCALFIFLWQAARWKVFLKIARQNEKNCLRWLFLRMMDPWFFILAERFLNYALIVFINGLGLFEFNFAPTLLTEPNRPIWSTPLILQTCLSGSDRSTPK